LNLELVALTARFKHSPCDTMVEPASTLLDAGWACSKPCTRISDCSSAYGSHCRRCLLFLAYRQSSHEACRPAENGAGWERRGGISTTAASIDLIQGKIGEAESDTETRLNFEPARPRGQIGHLRPQLREKLTRTPCCPAASLPPADAPCGLGWHRLRRLPPAVKGVDRSSENSRREHVVRR